MWPPWAMAAIMLRKASLLPDISRPTSKPSVMPRVAIASVGAGRAHVDGQRHAHLLGDAQPRRVHVGDHDVPRAGVAHHGRRQAADRPGAGDEHVLADQVERQRRVHGVAQRVEDGQGVERDPLVRRPHVDRREREVLGEGAGSGRADAHAVRTEVTATGAAVAAVAADDVPLAGRQLPELETAHPFAERDDPAHELVAGDQRHGQRALRPLVPLVDVHVRAADGGLEHADHHFAGAGAGDGDALQRQTRSAVVLHEREHGLQGVSFGRSRGRPAPVLRGVPDRGPPGRADRPGWRHRAKEEPLPRV